MHKNKLSHIPYTMEYITQSKYLIFIILCVLIFIDSVCTSLLLPIMPELFFNNISGLITHNLNISREFFYGLSFAIVPFAGIFGMPCFGILADRCEKIKIILTGLSLIMLCYLIATIAILIHNVYLFLISLLLLGFFSAIYMVTDAIIADLANNKNTKMKYFKLPMVFSLTGLILGPFLSAYINMNSNVYLSMHFFIACVLSIINLLLALLFFRNKKIKIREKINNRLSYILFFAKTKQTMIICMSTVFLQLGLGFFLQSLSLYLTFNYKYTSSQISIYFGVMSIMLIIGMYIVQPLLAKLYSYIQQLKFSLFVLCLLLFLHAFFSIPHQQNWIDSELMVWVITVMFYIFLPITNLGIMTVISNVANKEEQGRAMAALGQSIALSCFISALFIGYLAKSHGQIIFIISAISIFISYSLIEYLTRNKSTKLNL